LSAPSQPVDPASLYFLDFEVKKEGWSVYNLEDGNKIRARAIVTSIRGQRIPPQKGDLIAPETNITSKVDSPPNRRGPKGSPATPEELNNPKNYGGVEVGIVSSSEPWNEYHLIGTDVTIRTKLILNRAFRIGNRYDNFGDPIYVINFTLVPATES
jgi:hypothetical protein